MAHEEATGNDASTASNLVTQQAAQHRIDRIHAFNEELDALEAEGALVLTEEQKAALAGHQRRITQALAAAHELDLTEDARRLSLGMRVVSFLGAAALAASVFFLFYQFWGYLGTVTQVTVLVLAPLASLALTFLIARREATGYFAKIAALIAFACFVVDIVMLGQIFNIRSSSNSLALFAFYGFVLAYALNIRLLLAAAIVSVFAFVGAKTGTLGGGYWLYMGERPENFFLPAILIFSVPWLVDNARLYGFDALYRVLASIALFVAILVLANWGSSSYLPWKPPFVEGMYQMLGFGLSGLAIWWGMRAGHGELMTTGNVFFALFLYTKFFDWWWDWMPKFLFFFIIGLTAILILLVFRRLHASQQEAAR